MNLTAIEFHCIYYLGFDYLRCLLHLLDRGCRCSLMLCDFWQLKISSSVVGKFLVLLRCGCGCCRRNYRCCLVLRGWGYSWDCQIFNFFIGKLSLLCRCILRCRSYFRFHSKIYEDAHLIQLLSLTFDCNSLCYCKFRLYFDFQIPKYLLFYFMKPS